MPHKKEARVSENIQHSQHDRYEIRVSGHLDEDWTDWFDGLEIRREADCSTRLSGQFVDQASLFSLLRKVRDTGMKLLSVWLIVSTQSTTEAARAKTQL